MEEKKVTQSNRMWTKSNVQTNQFYVQSPSLDIDLLYSELSSHKLSPPVIFKLLELTLHLLLQVASCVKFLLLNDGDFIIYYFSVLYLYKI